MIVEYHRPESLEEALRLLSRKTPLTLPMGGGTVLNRPSPDPVAVVDLQSLGLNSVERRGNMLDLGSTLTLQALLDYEDLSPVLGQVIRYEASYNLRQAATVAGSLVASGGRSPFATMLLAMDAVLTLVGLEGKAEIGLGDLVPLRGEKLRGRLVTKVVLPLNMRIAFEYVARTPVDLPIVCAALARWSSGRTRLSLGGYGKAPLLAMDGPEESGLEQVARDAYANAEDQWASAEYRSEIAAILARRCLDSLVQD